MNDVEETINDIDPDRRSGSDENADLMEDMDDQEDSGDQGDEEDQEDDEDTMRDIESGQVERHSTPALAIETRPPRGDTPILEIGPDGKPISNKKRLVGSRASRSFDVGSRR